MVRRRRRRIASSLLDDLSIPSPFDLQVFVDSIAQQRGRPLLLLPLDGPALPELPCGIWLGLDEADLVFYDATVSDVLRTQIILHEIAHMLLGHTTPELTVAEETSPEELTRAGAYFEEVLSRVSGAETPDIPIAEIIRAEAARAQALAAAADPVDEFGVATDRILNLLGRTAFSSARERDAESLATLIHEQASRRSEVTATQADAAGTLGRLSDTFGHPARVRKK